ncbi:hypothetical protein B0H11DRAFT_1701290, partial [Mycena galericulata]
QEAMEKAREICVKADEEFSIEKVSFDQEQQSIDAEYETNCKEAENSPKMQSMLTNKSCLNLLHR